MPTSVGYSGEHLDFLDSIIDHERYSRSSFVRELAAGRVQIPELKIWAIQKYHQTFMQNRAFSAIHSNCEYEDVRQYEVDQLVGEETSLAEGTAAHYDLMKRFALACGADQAEVAATPASVQVIDFVDYLLGVCKNEHFVYGMLAVYVNERQTPEAVEIMLGRLRQMETFAEADLEWFKVHSTADINHSLDARRLIIKYAEEAPNFATKSVRVVRRGCAEWKRLQEYYFSIVSGTHATASG